MAPTVFVDLDLIDRTSCMSVKSSPAGYGLGLGLGLSLSKGCGLGLGLGLSKGCSLGGTSERCFHGRG